MIFINPTHSLRALLAALLLTLCIFPTLSWGAEDGEETIGLFTAWQGEAATASRAPKPLSQTAENVTVITRKEIEALNAHTLADVLATVPGVQNPSLGGPGSVANLTIQSTDFTNALVLQDGIPINNLGNNFADVAAVPAQIIERIEIIKGAASSVWGSALSGVINIITKSPEQERTIGGSATASIGERTTADTQAELSGSSGRLGYYLSGGYLGSNGLLPNTQLTSNNAYAKLTYDLPDKGQLWATFNYSRLLRGNLFSPPSAFDLKQDQNFRYLYASLGFRKPLTEQLELELIARHTVRNIDTFNTVVSQDLLFQDNVKDQASGTSAKLSWRTEHNLLVGGGDYEHAKTTDEAIHDGPNSLTVDRWGVFLNDTFTYGRLAVVPGIRFDRTQSKGDQFSPSFGATWQLSNSTMLRGYTARGFSLPPIDFNQTTPKIWTTQIGMETTAVPYLWLKGTLFRNESWNLPPAIDSKGARHITLGTELETRTTPVWNTSLGAGYLFTDVVRTSDGSEVGGGIPRHTVQLALRYDDQTYRGVLTGRHIWWNSNIDPGFNGKYYGLIWDLHLGATLLKQEHSSLELFFSGHNLFNGNQSFIDVFPTTGRWFEGGMKVRF